ncbi:tRNA (adenine(22)-N(1))-methyltransferase TrmK [Shewanella sp.]|uniref:tRNA (adenine(22)-N(1))-methyltransferase n=1 Tax=Shewanella sp. TaxID=50422 RepID=UPI002616BC24|nr:tRNA (adenine(22)-N(1))-methyltransferase TrmK [Shewanella sp.]
MKISQRLQQIDSMISGHYDHIWDCCCDHGLLGMLLLKRNAARQVHFVDCVAPLMQQLTLDLARFFPGQAAELQHDLSGITKHDSDGIAKWQVHCLDVAALPLGQSSDKDKQLIIIAGVGGELLVELVRAIVAGHSERRLEFILCPVHHNYYVRQSLAQLGLILEAEILLEENQRFYEILHVIKDSNACGQCISPSGSLMWDNLRGDDLALAKRYLHKVISHYQRMPKDKHRLSIINAYQAQLGRITGSLFP